MTRPVFFSVGGKQDTAFAGEVKRLLPDKLVYLYTKTGEEGVAFRPEIEAEIQGCRVFVAFWSEDYLASEHACRELALFKRLTESDPTKDRDLLIVPREEEKPNIQLQWTNPITQKTDEFVLGKWRNDRSLAPGADAHKVAEHVRRKVEKAKLISTALVPRGHIVDAIKATISRSDYKVREFLFVAGLEGDGRRTAVRQYMLAAFPSKTERQVSFDSAEGPEDLLPRLMDSASMTTQAREEILKAIASQSTTCTKEIRKIIHSGRESNSYYVITVDRYSAIDAPGIPHWVQEVFNVFADGNAPLVFFVTSNAVTDQLLQHYPNAGRVRIAGLDEHEIAELTHKLSLEDPRPNRWTNESKVLVANVAGSSPSLCKTIMLSMASEPNLDFLQQIAHREDDTFASRMAALLAHLVDRFKNRKNDLLALRVIEKLGIVSKQALDEILQPVLGENSYDLYQLREYGLVEQLADGIYRIPPLLQRRLGNALWGALRHEKLDELFAQFAKRMLITSDEYGAVYASNRVASAVRTGNAIPPELNHYLTLATLFKAGLERYSNKEFLLSHQILKRAMTRMQDSAAIDLTTQIEVARYSGLASARARDQDGVDQACSFLEASLAKSKRANQASAMALFIRGFQARLAKNWKDAVHCFQNALYKLQDTPHAERQRGAIYTELSATYLRMTPPKLTEALEMAEKAYAQKDVTHTLNAYIHALVLYVFRGGQFRGHESIQPEIRNIEVLLNLLDTRSKENHQDFHVDRRREYQHEYDAWAIQYTHQSAHKTSVAIKPPLVISQIEPEYP